LSKGNSPAFPCQDKNKQIYTGMNLRDYFALEAMNALIKKYEKDESDPAFIAMISYKVANAMLKERERHK